MIDWTYVIAASRFGAVRIDASETVSGLGYIIDLYGCPVRNDDLAVVLSKEIVVCCANKKAKPLARGTPPRGFVMPPPVPETIKKEPLVVAQEQPQSDESVVDDLPSTTFDRTKRVKEE